MSSRARPIDAELETITRVTAAATLAFLDPYLKDDPSARAYLQSDALVAFSSRAARLERK